MNRFKCVTLLVLVVLATPLSSQQYQINRAPDGPFAVRILGISFNQGSTLQRETVLLNSPSCPVQLTASNLTFDYQDRGFKYKVVTTTQVQQPITAIEIRYALYDVFGDHMRNLSNTEAKDLAAGPVTVDGSWNVFQENDVNEHLTTVTYVASVRFADGRIWKFQLEPLIAALRGLNLEQKVESDDRPARP